MTTRSKVPSRAPLYVRALRLRQLHVGGLASFLLFECMIAVGVLLALAELVSWWAVLILPAAVAIMVKVNDVAASAAARGRAGRRAAESAVGSASVSSRRSENRLDEWRDWDELTAAAETHGTTSLSRAELDRTPALGEAGTSRKTTPLARALARQKAEAALGEGTGLRSAVPMPEASPEPPPPAKQVGVIRISVPPRGKGMAGRGAAPQQESRHVVGQQARNGTYDDGSYDEPDPYERHDYDYESGGAHRSGYLGANDSFHADESSSGRHARGFRSHGHYADDAAYTTGGGRHADNGRRDDEITRQRSTLNQGRFA